MSCLGARAQGYGTGGGRRSQYTLNKSDGTHENLSEGQITAMILEEFYQKTQIMIGEAISASEVAVLLKHKQELGTK